MFEFKQKYPKAVLAFLADAGQGHFNASSELISFLAMFIKKAAKTRLPSDLQINKTIELINIDPKEGWLIDRWREDKKPIAPPAPYAEFKGDMKEAFWCFDKEMADMTEAYYEKTRGKLPQLLTINGKSGEPLIFTPQLLPDGVSFKIQTGFSDYVPKGHPVIWTKLPEGSKIDHADTGDISLHWIVGPAIQSATDTFRIQFSRAEYVPDRRNNDIWIYANHPGDKKYKSMVQQALFKVLPNKEGQEQTITFPEINNQKVGTKSIKLNATSTSGLPVQYYVLEGPAEIEGNTLKFTKIPPRSKLPIKVTIVAWQWGRGIEPKIKTAQNVTRSFLIEY